MVEQQLKGRGINDASVLAAMRKVPRHAFVPSSQEALAYSDQAIPLGPGKSISQPYVVAHMLEQLQLEPGDRVLDIGTGSGYQTAILAEIVQTVCTVEIDNDLYHTSQKVLNKLGYKNIHSRLGDGHAGWKEYAPFNKIILSAAAAKVPRALLGQLAEGGRMILPLGEEDQSLILVKKEQGHIKTEELGSVRFVPLVDLDPQDVH